MPLQGLLSTVKRGPTARVVLCAPLIIVASSVKAQTWQIDPSFDLRAGYDDNIRLREEQDDAATETRVGGSLELARLSEVSETRAYVRGTYIGYTSADDESLDDTESLSVGLDARYKPTELQGLQLLIDYTGDTVGGSSVVEQEVGDVDVVDGSVATQVDRDTLEVKPQWQLELSELSTIGIDYSYEDVEFDNSASTNLIDYDFHRLGGYYEYKWSDTTLIKPQLEAAAYESAEGEEVDSVQFRMGYEKRLTETSRFWINLGIHDTELTNGGETADDSGVLFDLNYDKQTERTYSALRVERLLAPSGEGELLETDSISAIVSTRFRERIYFNLYASFFTTEDAFGDQARVVDRKYAIVMPRISYAFVEHWRVGLQYRYRWSDDDNRMDSVDSSGVFLTLRYAPTKTAR